MLNYLIISVIAYTWINFLVMPNEIFGFISRWFWGFANKLDPCRKYKFFRFISKPLFDCEYCLSGQIALWYSVIIFDTVLQSITGIFISIFATRVITKLMGKSWN